MPFTITDVKNLIPVDSISDGLLTKYLEIVTTEADLQLNNIFADPLTPVVESDCINYKTQNANGSNFISISAWQQTGLTIKLTDEENQNLASLTESPLVLGQDYILWYGFKGSKIPGKTLPVTAIKLLCRKLHRSEILRVYGTYGWQISYPLELQQALANVIVSLASYANAQAELNGISGQRRIKDLTTEIEFSDEMSKLLREQAQLLMNNPSFVGIIAKYTNIFEQTVTVI
jgi:hypothetical protein